MPRILNLRHHFFKKTMSKNAPPSLASNAFVLPRSYFTLFRGKPLIPQNALLFSYLKGIRMPRKGIKKQFWLSEKHVKKLEKLSTKTRLPEVTIIRFLLYGYHPKEAPRDEFFTGEGQRVRMIDSLYSSNLYIHS